MIILILLVIIFIFINPKLLLLTTILVLIFLFAIYLISQTITINSKLEGNFRVKQVIGNGIIIEKGINKIFIKNNFNFFIDDLVYLNVEKIEKLNLSLNDDSFNNYLKSQGVFFIANKINKISLINKQLTFKQNVLNYFLDGPSFYSKYLPLTLLGYKIDWNQDIYLKLQNVSLIHLFVISGFHINLWIFILNKIVNKFRNQNKYIHLIIPLILVPYLWLINFPVSALRAYVFSYLMIANKYFWKNKYDSLDLLAITMLIFFLLNPYIISSISFLLSFLISYAILLITRQQKQKFLKLKIHIVAWLSSTFLLTYLNQNLNLTGLFTNLILSPIVILIYFISSLMFFIKPLMDNLFYLFDVVINLLEFIAINIDLKINLWVIVSSYFLLFSCLIFINGKQNWSKTK